MTGTCKLDWLNEQKWALRNMSGWRSQSSLVMKLSMDQRTGGIKSFFSCQQLKMSVWVAGKKKLPAAQNRQPEKKLLHKSVWVGATYLWHSGRHRKQHFSKWKSFSIKSSAHGRQNHTPTEGPKSLPALCYICPWPIFKSCHKVLGEKKK